MVLLKQLDTSLSEENLELKIQMEFKRVGLEEIIQRVRVGRKGPEHRSALSLPGWGRKGDWRFGGRLGRKTEKSVGQAGKNYTRTVDN